MAEITKIQLRGISRTPSDRMTKDGGCAESLNVYMDNDELAPVLVPKDVTVARLNTDSITALEDVFIHKTTSEDVYVVVSLNTDTDKLEFRYHIPIYGYRRFLAMEAGETIRDICSIGNTLVVAGSINTYYVLYSGGVYELLGTQIPHFGVEVKPRYYEDHPNEKKTFDVLLYDSRFNSTDTEIDDIGHLANAHLEAWQTAIARNDDKLNPFNEAFWSGFQVEMRKAAKGGLFYYPLMVRYATRLFDGSYVQHSVPILIGAGHRRMMSCSIHQTIHADVTGINEHYLTTTASVTMEQAFSIDAKLVVPAVSGKWADIIESVDLFISEPLMYPEVNSSFASAEDVAGDVFLTFQNLADSEQEDSAIKDMLTSISNFYKIDSYNPFTTTEINTGKKINNKEEYYLTEKLYTQERLPDDYRSNHSYVTGSVHSFNNRLLTHGVKERLYGGEGQPAALARKDDGLLEVLEVCYEIIDSTGTSLIVKTDGFNNQEGVEVPFLIKEMFDEIGNTETSIGSMYAGWVAYPDTRCVAMYFRNARTSSDTTPWQKITMEAHPYLQCAYAYLGIDQSIEDVAEVTQIYGDLTINDISDSYSDYLFQSRMGNPFSFPAEGRIKLAGGIIGFAIASMAMSEGQYGQFPLYAFTKEGIWTLSTADDGRIASSVTLSREVCISPDSITSIDQAVVFLTDKGLMLLQGSQITDISPNMNGRRYVIEPVAMSIIEAQHGFSEYSDILSDSTPFVAFMKKAKIAYDYAGKRLVCIHPDKMYQYVFKMDTQTWHKTAHGVNITRPLNSYPEALALAVVDGKSRIYNLSTQLDVSIDNQDTERAIIATRPFDLGYADVLKTITDVRIRGQFPKTAVKFILLGSKDGINFYTLSTLRGRSWKMFRIIILADLDAVERISWIEVQFETRLTDRLR